MLQQGPCSPLLYMKGNPGPSACAWEGGRAGQKPPAPSNLMRPAPTRVRRQPYIYPFVDPEGRAMPGLREKGTQPIILRQLFVCTAQCGPRSVVATYAHDVGNEGRHAHQRDQPERCTAFLQHLVCCSAFCSCSTSSQRGWPAVFITPCSPAVMHSAARLQPGAPPGAREGISPGHGKPSAGAGCAGAVGIGWMHQ